MPPIVIDGALVAEVVRYAVGALGAGVVAAVGWCWSVERRLTVLTTVIRQDHLPRVGYPE
jgi:hypothetical protein